MKILQLLKKKKWIIPVVSLLLSLTVGAVVIFTYNRNDEPLAPPSNSMSICLTPPSEGNPNDYSGLDNIGYIAGKLRSQPYFHSESKGSVNTMVTQDFLGYKDYKDGKLIASTISIAHSNLAPSNAIQKFFSDGKVVIRRAQSDNPSDWDGDNTVWATGAPSEVLDENAYIMRYGLPATELTEFIINAESLISCTTPVKGEDGVYTMTAKLDNEKSTYYYRMQMKTMGGLNSYPSFQNIEITFHFQEDWTLLSMDVHEEYETYVSVITAACVADTNVVFSYEEDKVDVSPYEDYFKEYANADTTETVEPERTATTYLASGFGPLINGQKCLSFTASVGENSFDGLIDLDMSLVPAMELKGLQLNIGGLVAGLKGEDIVVHYKDFTGKLALDELTSLFASGGNDGGSADGGVSLDTEALLDGIMNAPIVRENGKAIISAELDVAGMPISICFTFDDGEEVQLEKVEAALTLMDIPVKLEAQLCDKSVFPNVSFGAAVDLAPYIEDVKAFIENKAFAVDITYGNAGDELQVVGSAVLNIKDGLSAYVSAQVTYAGATLPVELTFVDNTVYVAANGIRLQGTVDEIKALVNEILPLVSKDGAQSMDELLPAMPEIKVEQILGAVFAVSFDEILTTLSVSDESLNITVDGDKLLTVLKDLVGDINFELGDITLGYDRASGTVTASVLGANVTLTSTTDSVSAPENAADYIDLGTVTGYVPEIVELINSKAFAVEIAYGNAGDELQVVGSAVLNIKDGLSAYVSAQVTYAGATLPVELTFVDNTVYVAANGIRLQGTVDEIKALVNEILPLVSKDGAQSMDELLPAMPEIKVEQILGAVFAVSFDEILTTLSVSDESLNITVDGDKLLTVLKDLVGDINFELGDITLGYDRASGTVTASVLGANVTLTSTTDSVSAPSDTADFVSLADVTPIVHSVVEALTAEHLAFNATLSTTVEGLDIGVDVEGYVTLGEQIGVYAKVNLAIFGGVETLEILYKDGGLTVVYGGVALQVTKDDVNIIVEQIVEIFGGDSESGEAQPLTDTEGTIDIIGLVNAIALTSETDGELTKLRLTAALAGIFGAETVSDLDATLFVSGGRTRVETSALTVSGITLENVALGIGAVETVAEPDFSSVPVCKNVLEFLLAAYRELADSEYASLDFGFKTNEMNVSLNGLVQFASKENSTASIINVDAKAEIETFKWDDAASAYVSSGTHYIHLTILEEQLWASYSLKGMDADTAVYVTLPISELFVAGQTVLPLMAPMLGISEDIYYYDFIVKILDGKYPTINTDIIDMMTLEEWIALVLRAIEAEGVALATEEVESSNTAVQPTVSFGESAEGNTTIAVDAGEMSATITMLTNGAAAITVPTNKTYIDISTIATLLTDVLHAYDYAKNYNGYALSGSLAIGVGSLDLKNIGVNLQIKTDDGISVAATITPKSGTTTYLTVKDGMFYITRVVVKEDRRMTGFFKWTTYIVTTTEHRAMTAEQFLGDMMEQIYFILNLSDTEIWIIDTAMKNSTPSTGPSEYDAGDMVKNYSFTPVSGADKATYDITLSLGAIMNNSAFGDVSATITREKLSGKDYYDLTNISATVGISVLKASINLTHDGAKDVNNIKPQTVAENVARVVSGLGYMDEAAVKAATAGGIVSYSNTTEVVKS